MKKGVILLDGYSQDEHGNHNRINHITLEDLRFCLLFWDKIDKPVSMVNIEPPEDFRVLMQEGIATRTEVDIEGLSGADWMKELTLKSQIKALEKLSDEKDTDWSLGQTSDVVTMPSANIELRAVCEFNLYNAIASPIGDVSIHDVLEFKSFRNDELQCLRQTIDDCVYKISANPGDKNAYDRELDRVKLAISDYQKVIDETKFQTIKRNFTTFFAAPALGVVTVAGMIDDFHPYMDAINLLGVGSCVAGMAYKALFIEKNIPLEHKPIAYLVHAGRELGN
ncbi:DUF6236 family protein [Klebsiella aerogenes]|uniref:DUF6236 family protein n=1 Tax=Klebsiella aerogenes TaxID=548 RepID=UPI0018686DE1|nr:DUF6236 family protein [Klebsiella aerogenes]MEB6107597.1 DUF6236 family protein [Klebsiella aerogenes]